MGVPSISIYAHELITEYGARADPRRHLRLDATPRGHPRPRAGQSASTDSSTVSRRFPGMTFAPTADLHLLRRAWQSANDRGFKVHAGDVLSTDTFYDVDQSDGWKTWASHDVLAVEMVAAGLYTTAERQAGFADRVLAALDAAIG